VKDGGSCHKRPTKTPPIDRPLNMPLPLATPGCGKNSKKAKQIQPSYSKITSQTEEQSVLNHALLAVSEQYGISKYYG
jgi:hypothetical protein